MTEAQLITLIETLLPTNNQKLIQSLHHREVLIDGVIEWVKAQLPIPLDVTLPNSTILSSHTASPLIIANPGEGKMVKFTEPIVFKQQGVLTPYTIGINASFTYTEGRVITDFLKLNEIDDQVLLPVSNRNADTGVGGGRLNEGVLFYVWAANPQVGEFDLRIKSYYRIEDFS